MKKTASIQYEQQVRQAFAEGDYGKAHAVLEKSGNKIHPASRAIFEASIALANGEYQDAWEAVAGGLRLDGRNYELYVLLGEYYGAKNLRQAYLCYENALFYCDNEEDSAQIRLLMEQLAGQGASVPKAAIVILSYNLLGMTKDCIRSIRKTTPDSAREIIVVDNASADGSVAWLQKQGDIKLLCNSGNRGFPAACNQGIGLAEADSDIFLLNNDTVMTDNALFWLRMGLYENDQVGSAGSVTNHASNFQAVTMDGQPLRAYLDFAKTTNIPLTHPYLNKLHLVGFALLMKRAVLDQVGLLDERFSPGNFEDNDICLRISLAGYGNVLCKNSFIIHWGSKSFGKDLQKYNDILEMNQRKFFHKWKFLRLDPAGYLNHRMDLVAVLQDGCSSQGNITAMVAGTGCGGILSCLQDKFPKAQVYGMEPHPHMARIAGRIADTVCVDPDAWKGDGLAGAFDVIIVNNMLEAARDPGALLAELAKMLKQEGQLLLSFANPMHYSRLQQQDGSGSTLDRKRVYQLLSEAGLTRDNWTSTLADNGEDDLGQIFQALQERYPDVEQKEFHVYQWIMMVEKQRDDIRFGDKMAVCVPTYNHPEVVEDVLSHCAELYHRYGLDVYYYDSSENENTKKVVEAYQAQGYDNLHYIWVDPEKYPLKAKHIFLMDWIQKEYMYMWFLRDRCWCEEKTLRLMHKAMEEPHDLIFLDVGNTDCPIELSVCRDANEFYHRCGDYATSIDATIYNVQSIFRDGFSMEEFMMRHDSEYRDPFAHFLIIFEQLAKKKKPDICLLSGKNVAIFHSPKGRSRWHEGRLKIWGTSWIQANEALPGCYTHKDEVIKWTASKHWILGDVDTLVDLHGKGILTPEYFEEIRKFWERVSDIPLETLRQIAYGEYH